MQLPTLPAFWPYSQAEVAKAISVGEAYAGQRLVSEQEDPARADVAGLRVRSRDHKINREVNRKHQRSRARDKGLKAPEEIWGSLERKRSLSTKETTFCHI